MKKQRAARGLALLAVFALIASACGGDDDTTAPAETAAQELTEQAPEQTAASETTAAPDAPAETAPADEASMTPGEGTTITMARANWKTGYFQAQVYKQLLEELGYEVTEPSELELAAGLAFLAMAEGDFDFWGTSWYPAHSSWWEPELPDGSQVGDHISIVGNEMLNGGLEGLLDDQVVRRGARRHPS